MTAPAALTGQESVLLAIKSWAEVEGGPMGITLTGPSGSGKSWVVRELKKRLNEDRLVLVAEGDPFNGNRQLLPLATALAKPPNLRRLAKTAASEASSGIPYAGGLIQFSLNMLLNYREIAQASQTSFLEVAEREVLLEIQQQAESKEVLLVLENLHWWDEQSLDLLGLMLQKRLDNVFPFLTRTKYLAIQTPAQDATHSHKFSQIRQLLGGASIELRHCEETKFGELLTALGARELPDAETVAALYRSSQGHLAMAQRLAERLNTSTTPLALSNTASMDALCRELIEERISALGDRGTRMARLLRQAAAIGLSFTDTEMRCLAKDLAPEISNCLADARELELLAADSDRLVFSHEIIQRYFSHVSSERDPEVHSRFAECLRVLRPGDYRARSHHHTLAGQAALAADAQTHQALAELRIGSRSLGLLASGSHLPSAHRQFIQTMSESWSHFDAGRYAEALEGCRRIDNTLPSSLLAERDCLIARCHINGLTSLDWESAIRVLQKWITLLDSELEVWGRIMLIRIVALVYSGDVEAAKAAAHEMSNKLSPRMAFDNEAKRTLGRLKLKSDMFYVPEAAGPMIAEALEIFGPRDRQPEVVDPLNYFVGLTNLSANQILKGEFMTAFETARDGERFLSELHEKGEHFVFPRVDMLANNLIVAGFRGGTLTASAAATLQGQAIASAASTVDNSLLRSNLSAFLALEGRPNDAQAILLELISVVSSAPDYDAYYAYFVLNNLAGTQFALGEIDSARETWEKASEALTRIEMPIRPTLDKRHALQAGCLTVAHSLTVTDWERHIFEIGRATEVGPSWRHFARGFLLSDLQYWAED
jgi:AAA ATPase domain